MAVNFIPTPQLKPEPQTVSIPGNLSNGGIFSGISNFVGGISKTATNIATTAGNVYSQVLTAKSNLESAKVAQSLERIKNDAILRSANQAPTVSQIALPSVADSISNPQGAAGAATPALLAGGIRETFTAMMPQQLPSGGTISTGILLAGLGVLAIFALKK